MRKGPRLNYVAVFLAILWAILVGSAVSAAPILIDDYSQPNPEAVWVVSVLNADPHLHKTTDGSILGGQRDLLIDVIGTIAPTSATGTIGTGSFDFGSSDVVTATLQYDGVDADIVGPPSGLANANGLATDLTGGGTNNQLRLSFINVDPGPAQTTIGVSVALTGPAGATASFSGVIPESANPFDYPIPFASFTTAGGFLFSNVQSITLTLNTPPQSDTDFELDSFSAVPEPASAAVLVSLLGGAAALVRRRQYV